MVENLGGVTSQLIELSLDAALLRHRVIANNIANSDTPGFQARRLSFESQLAGVTELLASNDDALIRERIDSLKTAMQDSDAMVLSTDESVELDREMVRLTENTLRYQALLQAAGKRGDIVKMAVREGRRS